MDRNAINKGRALYYSLFSSFFAFALDDGQYQQICRSLELVKENPIDEPSEDALSRLYPLIKDSSYGDLKTESDMVFYSPTTSFIPMTASFYDEERDDGKKRLEMINHVLLSPFRRDSNHYRENEDHIEFICLFMQKMLENDNEELATAVFSSILNPMLDSFCEKLYQHEEGKIYHEVATLFYSFCQCERLLLNIAAPEKLDSSQNAKPNIRLRKEKKAPRRLVERNSDEFGPI